MTQNFSFQKTEISGLLVVTPFHADDIRGGFTKDYSTDVFNLYGVRHDIQEVFYSTSHKGVVRGLHFQRVKQQEKLVRCIYGHIYDVVVDLRGNSPTFKKWLGFDLTGENHLAVLVPAGCAHGFIALEESMVSYKCNMCFSKQYDGGIRWNDPDINVAWPLEAIGDTESVILSDKDRQLPLLKDFLQKYGAF